MSRFAHRLAERVRDRFVVIAPAVYRIRLVTTEDNLRMGLAQLEGAEVVSEMIRKGQDAQREASALAAGVRPAEVERSRVQREEARRKVEATRAAALARNPEVLARRADASRRYVCAGVTGAAFAEDLDPAEDGLMPADWLPPEGVEIEPVSLEVDPPVCLEGEDLEAALVRHADAGRVWIGQLSDHEIRCLSAAIARVSNDRARRAEPFRFRAEPAADPPPAGGGLPNDASGGGETPPG
jgi:hypothetical protein